MTQISKNQQGFGVVEGLLIVIILLLVVFIGYYVYNANSKTTDTYNAASDSASTPTTITKKKAANQSSYLTIKDWGVKFPLTSDLNGGYYLIKNNLPNVAYLSLDKYKGTNCSAEATTLGAVIRFTATDKNDDGSLMTSTFTSAVKIGSYYYIFQNSQAACDGQDDNSVAGINQAEATKASALMASFKTATDHIVAAN